MNNYLLALIVILTMILIMEAVRFLRLRKCCGKDRCKCGERKDAFYREKRLFLKQLGESGLLAQEIAEKEKHVGLQKVQINTLLQEFHSLVFFGYLKPDYEAGFKKELEKHYETFVQKADKRGVNIKKTSPAGRCFFVLMPYRFPPLLWRLNGYDNDRIKKIWKLYKVNIVFAF